MSEKLNKLIQELNKKHGEGSIFRLGDKPSLNIPVISTGKLSVDVALGIHGIPLGKFVEVYSDSSVGKSSFCLGIASQAQKSGYTVAYIDGEHAISSEYAQNLGINLEELFFSQPTSAEEGFDIVEKLIESGEVKLIIIDSVDSLLTQRELDGDLGDSDVGVKAKFMSKVCRKLKGKVAESKCSVIFISQLRDNIGAMGYAEKTVTTGGKALKFYSDVRIQLKRIGQLKSGEDVVGHQVSGVVVKNKLAAPAKKFDYDVYYDDFDTIYSELVNLGVEGNFIEKSGAWFTVNGTRVQGKENLRKLLKEDKEIRVVLEEQVRGWLGLL